MRLTKQTLRSIELLILCAGSGSSIQTMTLGDAAATLGTSKDYLCQLMKPLTRHGFLVSRRGRNGGIRLSCPASRIELLDVLLKLEPTLVSGMKGRQPCGKPESTEAIVFEGVMQNAMLAFCGTLRGVTLKHLAAETARCKADGHALFDSILPRGRLLKPVCSILREVNSPAPPVAGPHTNSRQAV